MAQAYVVGIFFLADPSQDITFIPIFTTLVRKTILILDIIALLPNNHHNNQINNSLDWAINSNILFLPSKIFPNIFFL